MDGEHVSHVVIREVRRSVKTNQVQRDILHGVVEKYGLVVIDEVVSIFRGLTVADIGAGAAVVHRRRGHLVAAKAFSKSVNENASSYHDQRGEDTALFY